MLECMSVHIINRREMGWGWGLTSHKCALATALLFYENASVDQAWRIGCNYDIYIEKH